MKKSFIIKMFCLLITILIIISIIRIFSGNINLKDAYKLNWNVDMLNPESEQIIYLSDGLQDGSSMIIYEYNADSIEILKNKDYFKQIDVGNVNNILKLNFNFLKNSCDNCIFKYLTKNNIKRTNYYAYFYDTKDHYTLLILDVENNLMYELTEF